VLRFGCQAILAAAFLLSGASKFIAPEAFLDHLAVRVGLWPALAWAVAAFLPALELTCGLCLAMNCAVREATSILGGLLLLFLGYLLFHGAGDCPCFLFARASDARPWWSMARNVLLLCCCLPLTRRSKPSLPAPRLPDQG
jgi:hypothetical protein